jgi:hypothetical protein
MAVGSYNDSSGTAALAERWDGRSWAIQPTPQPPGTLAVLYGVSCTSAGACTAVGSYYSDSSMATLALAERWNGQSWKIQPTPVLTGSRGSTALGGVSCTSADACTAAGSRYPNSLGYQVTLAEAWNGTSWRVEPTPNPQGTESYLSGVSCTSATACTAAGSYYPTPARLLGTLAEAWNGVSWKLQATPNPAGGNGTTLAAVSCAGAHYCVAAGFDARSAHTAVNTVEVWDGITWRLQKNATPRRTYSGLEGVSCVARDACMAIGSYYPANSGDYFPLAETWNGASWKLQAVPSPHGSTGTDLPAASCISARNCTAVGSRTSSSGTLETLAESWNGTSWTIQPTPDPQPGVMAPG